MEDLFEILDKIQDRLREKHRPTSLVEALRLESCRLYTYTALEICKRKLEGSVDKESFEKMKEIKKYFEYIEEVEKTFVDDKESRDLLLHFYPS